MSQYLVLIFACVIMYITVMLSNYDDSSNYDEAVVQKNKQQLAIKAAFGVFFVGLIAIFLINSLKIEKEYNSKGKYAVFFPEGDTHKNFRSRFRPNE
jgi:hypothetical protein